MKISLVFPLFVAVLGAKRREPTMYAKFSRVEFSTSGKTCTNPYGNIIPISRYETKMNFGCDIQRPLNHFNLSFTTCIAGLAGSYRQIIDVKNIDLCAVLNEVEKYPIFRSTIEVVDAFLPGVLHKCPYTSFKVANASMSNNHDIGNRKTAWQPLPNGLYRHTISLDDDLDKNIGVLKIFFIAKYHTNVYDI